MANKTSGLISFPMRVSHEVERLFDEMIHRPWGFCRDIRAWNPSHLTSGSKNCVRPQEV